MTPYRAAAGPSAERALLRALEEIAGEGAARAARARRTERLALLPLVALAALAAVLYLLPVRVGTLTVDTLRVERAAVPDQAAAVVEIVEGRVLIERHGARGPVWAALRAGDDGAALGLARAAAAGSRVSLASGGVVPGLSLEAGGAARADATLLGVRDRHRVESRLELGALHLGDLSTLEVAPTPRLAFGVGPTKGPPRPNLALRPGGLTLHRHGELAAEAGREGLLLEGAGARAWIGGEGVDTGMPVVKR